MGEGWNIAVVGATGAVGEAILELLQEREFPIGELTAIASEDSIGKSVRVNSKSVAVQGIHNIDWADIQLAFFAAPTEISAQYAQQAADAGCIIIDCSGIFAMDWDVPLVVPGVNSAMLAEYRTRNIVSIADSMVSQLLRAINPLTEAAGLTRLSVTNLMSVSRLGKQAVDELAGQSARLLNGIPPELGRFNKQLAFNILPLMVDDEGSVQEERRMVDQIRKILQDEGLPISVTTLQAPVFYGNAQSVQLETSRPMGSDEARETLQENEDLSISEENDFPTQVTDASGNVNLNLGCFRNDYGMPEALQFWSVADNVRFGGALMAVEVAEQLMQEQFY
ncbi:MULTISPECIES: aspartate-semialdehyde dehydrogenase [Proteus]|jgi:aspartate-semialdehyde dehydrogenase|uniref:Putative semialdehyde dehydrogenase n=1 Tax=Proteus vulgaris TaxID=585 RepID=A0A379FC06_PROVU|nr:MULTISPECIES: aspartate-semialdehyde dehydrogenase [Proteus]RNT28511.1 aspartate-semialdehyde dehydrogenase [Proteus mirabilis]KGA59898.1 semialdehyde dehydrogenase, dimerization domain protein [Proteus vulgaris]MBG5969816.1 aspartate-semialdehyde dehydrogenase [Proteus vulgaris]MBG5985522.1 aspartate-semialdehyde dehydrogenase [Proteus vulgaris]MBW3473589.1 aspartate-semialdehyde dehydrogenase [Proteus vulgaris]